MSTRYETPTFEVVEIVAEESFANIVSGTGNESTEISPGSWRNTATTSIWGNDL